MNFEKAAELRDATEIRRAEQLAEHDEYIINSLVKCSVFKNFPNADIVPDWPTIFSLIWGDHMASHECFPASLQSIVADILVEERKCAVSYDLQEKQVHKIIIDLLQVMYKEQVNILVQCMKEEAG